MSKKNWFKLFSFFLMMVLLIGCGSGGDNTTIQTTPAIIPATTKVLDSSSANNILGISQDGAQITFSGTTPQIDSLEVGDIIACEPSSSAPSGLLRKITSIDIGEGGQIIVTTTDVPIEEAVQKGSWSITQSLSSNQVVKTVSRAKGVGLIQSISLGKFIVPIENVILYDGDGDEINTTNDQIIASGSIEIEPSYTFSGDIDDFKLKNLIFTNTTTETCSITLSANVSLVNFDKRIEIAKYIMPTVTAWIGVPPTALPILITPILTVYVGISGNISVGISTGIVQQASFTNGLSYSSSSGWSIIEDHSMNFDFTPPTLTAAATAKCYAGLELELLAYGAAGPNASADIYLELDANPLANPWWQLYGGIEANAGVELEIFSHVVASYSANIFDYQVLIAEADGGVLPWCVADGVYRVYGGNSSGDPQNISSFNQSDWTYIGEGTETKTFSASVGYRWILITWSGNPTFYFDAIVDEVSSLAFGSFGYEWLTDGITNYLVNTTASEPSNFKGDHDAKYASTMTIGYSLFNTSNPLTWKNFTIYVTKTP